MKESKKKSRRMTALLVLLFFAGLSLVLYPTVSNYWNSLHQVKVISTYTETVAQMSAEETRLLWDAAERYNLRMRNRVNDYSMSDEEQTQYDDLLNLNGDGIMGYLEIPSLDVTLPIGHGVADELLRHAVGHVSWTSLPIGGEGTHCVISGHRGLPSAKLFTNLDKLTEGDLFQLHILHQTLTYEVDQILIVEPEETQPLLAVEGQDYCTLVTCTPYGINTHRLLVRGHRVPNPDDLWDTRVIADAVQIRPLMIALPLTVPLFLIALAVVSLPDRKRKKYSMTEVMHDEI